jgi:hypothetical protein
MAVHEIMAIFDDVCTACIWEEPHQFLNFLYPPKTVKVCLWQLK